jgi:hypothetical protein
MKRVTRLSVVRNEKRAATAKAARANAFARVRECTAELGDDFIGYAMVFWGRDGQMLSVLRKGGPVMPRMLPAVVHDALQQHVTSDMTEEEIGFVPPPAPEA